MVTCNKYFDIYNDGLEKGVILYNNPEKKISFGLLEKGDYLIVKASRNYKIKKDSLLLVGLLPLLELDVMLMKAIIEKRGLDFYEIVPVEKIILTAFDDGFSSSIYWKERSINWIKKLNYSSSVIIDILVDKSTKQSNLPKDFKLKMQKLAIQLKTVE